MTDWWTALLAVGAAQGLVLALALWTPPARQRPALLAAGAVSTVTLILAEELLDLSGLQRTLPHTAGLTMNLELALGPFVLLHIRSLYATRSTTRWEGLHFAPYALSCLFLLPFYLADGPQKLDWLRNPPDSLELLFTVKGLHLLAYLGWSWRELRAHVGTSGRAPGLYRGAVGLALGLGAASFVLHHLSRSGASLALDSDRFSALVLTALLGLATYAALRHWRRGVPTLAWGAGGGPGRGPGRPYQTSGLTPSRMRRICDRVEALMHQEQLYRDGELRLEHLARRLGVSSQHLSQSLNQSLGESFYELVSRLRVDEFQASLQRPENRSRSILDLAFEAGFNSKAAFHRSFKRSTGTTPSAFRRSLTERPKKTSPSIERDDNASSRL